MAGEGNLQDKIIKYLEVKRDVYFFNKWGNAVEEGGIPDIVMGYKGMFIGFELKNPNGTYKVDLRQKVHIKKIQRAGCKAYVIESFEQFVQIFESL